MGKRLPDAVAVQAGGGVSFQNGEPFNAEAAAYGIIEATKPGVSGGFIYFLAGTTPTPVAVDEYTLDINCDKPCPIMPKSLAYTAFVAPQWFAGASEEERRSKLRRHRSLKWLNGRKGSRWCSSGWRTIGADGLRTSIPSLL